jgi:hypothetical protein
LAKLYVKKKNGKAYIREKSKESAATLEEVHPNKVKSWLALSVASGKARGKSMEDVIQSVSDEMKSKVFKEDKPKVQVTEKEYQELLIQAFKKGDSEKELNMLVEVVAEKKREPTVGEWVEVSIRVCPNPKCKHPNDTTAKFCNQCRTKLESS